jgi:tetratricopeptide (TPR) repeat protein
MHLETSKRGAFQKLQEAQKSLTSFAHSKARSELTQAKKALEQALDIDPHYLRAVYYRGLVRDMLGQPKEAVGDFRLVLDQRPPFLPEVRYNLGVATFHQYGFKNLSNAVQQFQEVINSTEQPALKIRARAAMAHAYAVMMIPQPGRTDDCQAINEFLASDNAREHVEKYYRLSEAESDQLASEIKTGTLDPETEHEIRWRLGNTRAVQRMFYTDYFDEDRIEKLLEGEQALIEADLLNPRNWSLYCNRASTYMRLGHWTKRTKKDENSKRQAEEYFGKAIEILNEVINDLLPNYGFALYEKGRVYRLWGNFDAASVWLNKALDVTENRAVSDTTLKCELQRVELKSTDYPYLSPAP